MRTDFLNIRTIAKKLFKLREPFVRAANLQHPERDNAVIYADPDDYTNVRWTPTAPSDDVILYVPSGIGGGELTWLQLTANDMIGRGSSGAIVAMSGADVYEEILATHRSGSSFPTLNLWDGRPFYRTDLHAQFYYDSGASGWLGADMLTPLQFSYAGNRAATNYFRLDLDAGAGIMSSTIGLSFGFPVKCVGMEAHAAVSSTATARVVDDGTGVTNATVSLSSATTASDDTLLSNTIAANSIIAVEVSSGTFTAASWGVARFKRFET